MKRIDLLMTRIEGIHYMKRMALLLVAVATATGAVVWAQTSTSNDVKQPVPPSAKEIRGASPYAEIQNELPPKLYVDEPLPEGLAQGIVWIQWRVENLNVVPVFGKGAVHVSPRVGHLHVHVDDVGWWWADPSGINTIDIAGLSEGPHKVRLELVNANHEPFPGQSKTVTFTIPRGASLSLKHRH
jgi:hypothetical protein